MSSAEKYSKAEKSYQPSEYLTNLLEKYLLYHKRKTEFTDRILAEGMSEEQANAVKEDLKHVKDNLDKEKVDILNKYIFRAMANLTVLVEKVQEDPYIREIFENDLKALFFAESTEIEANTPVFLRFIRGCVYHNSQVSSTDMASDFRFILAYFMQHTIHEMIKKEASYKLEKENKYLFDAVLADMMRSLAWTHFFSGEARRGLTFRKERRPVLF